MLLLLRQAVLPRLLKTTRQASPQVGAAIHSACSTTHNHFDALALATAPPSPPISDRIKVLPLRNDVVAMMMSSNLESMREGDVNEKI